MAINGTLSHVEGHLSLSNDRVCPACFKRRHSPRVMLENAVLATVSKIKLGQTVSQGAVKSLEDYIERRLSSTPFCFDAHKVSVLKTRYLTHVQVVDTVVHKGIAMPWPVCAAPMLSATPEKRNPSSTAGEKEKMQYLGELIEFYRPNMNGGPAYCIFPAASNEGDGSSFEANATRDQFWKKLLYSTAIGNANAVSTFTGLRRCSADGDFDESHRGIREFIKDGASLLRQNLNQVKLKVTGKGGKRPTPLELCLSAPFGENRESLLWKLIFEILSVGRASSSSSTAAVVDCVHAIIMHCFLNGHVISSWQMAFAVIIRTGSFDCIVQTLSRVSILPSRSVVYEMISKLNK